MALQLLKQLRHQHGIFSSGNTDGDLVPVLDQLVFVDRLCELPPDLFAELFDNAALDLAAAVRILPPGVRRFCLFHGFQQLHAQVCTVSALHTVYLITLF